ncbi:hypothetical protein DFH08DRAFT_797405 [Mycena albidolilacea]|uniref:Uncharacterized protein n=1 Tax=Mycena albidolilacea TaxID=1033008 RepID=A0AAD7F328_9AGAR|nr:hypothetical protein DFH08DRAFT_797405 [Mycena albidolilacea]
MFKTDFVFSSPECTGRQKAKQDVKTNTVWLAKELKSNPKDKTQPKDGAKAKNQADNKTESHKRTLSSIASPRKPKRPQPVSSYFNYSSRPSLISSSDESGEQEVLTEGKGKSKAKVKTRKHAAPIIAIDTDNEDEPQQKTMKAKTKTAMKASKTPVVPVKAANPTAALKPAKLVADSNSESESSDDSEEHNVSGAGAPNAEEFLIEAPHIIGKRKSIPIVSNKEDNEANPLLKALKQASELKAKKEQLSNDNIAGFDSDHNEGLANFTLYNKSSDEEEPAAKPKVVSCFPPSYSHTH